MKILVDADGCPVVDIAIKTAQSYDLEIIIVKNFSHELWDDYATIVTVDQSPDSADYYIVNHATKGDIVITQDYGLAAMALAKEALCINQNGLIISSKNIDQLLARRHINREIRRKHNKYTKFKKRELKQDTKFEHNLRYLIEKSIE
ncbi:MAG: DUF188 domain-containing protein [Tepidanaerobacteraceae bacterium]|nr:DUF188 domain-containing protein [Tepidanaerobacteraceae bacterium]